MALGTPRRGPVILLIKYAEVFERRVGDEKKDGWEERVSGLTGNIEVFIPFSALVAVTELKQLSQSCFTYRKYAKYKT